MKIKREGLIIGTLFKKLAPRIGATVVLESQWGMVGQITYKSGVRRYFRYNSVDLNLLGASRLASDKDYANFFMRRMGYPTVEGKTFFRKDFARAIGAQHHTMSDAVKFAHKLGFPLIVKPNSGSQGSGVFLVYTQKELGTALGVIWKQDRIALVQKHLIGRDYRVVVLDNQVISAYERIPLSVVGDGKSTIQQLLEQKKKYFQKIGRDTQIKQSDPRILYKLARQKLSLRSKLADGQRVSLLDNANLSTGGDSVDVTSTIHPDFKKVAINVTRDMGLRFSGVDLMITKGSIDEKPIAYSILEINDTPGLDHYATTGPTQRKIVANLYLEVLKSMEHS